LLLDATNRMSEKKKLFWRRIKRHAGTNRFMPLQIKLQIVGAQTIFVFQVSLKVRNSRARG
jgi:hypothetical protein